MDSRGKCALVVAACCFARSRLSPTSAELTFVSAGSRVPGAQLRQEGALATARVGAPASSPAQGSPDVLATVAAAATAGFVGGIASRCGRPAPRTPCLGKKKGGKGGKGGGGKRGGAQEPAGGDGGEEAPEIDTEELMMEWEEKMGTTAEMLRTNLVGIRAGKATPALLESLKVNAYDSQMGIQEVGTITVKDTTTLEVTVFDEDVAPAVEKAIRVSDLGYGVQTAGSVVRISIPELTKDKRQQYIKLAKDYTEKARVAMRNVRQGAMKKVKQLSKQLSEDTVKGMQSDIEAMVKKNIGELDKMCKNKETELSKV